MTANAMLLPLLLLAAVDPAQRDTAPPPPLTITTRWADAVNVLSVEQSGPYAAAARRFRDAARLLRETEGPGAIYVRYDTDPSVEGVELRAQVGVLPVPASVAAPAPAGRATSTDQQEFQRGSLPAEFVAVAEIEGADRPGPETYTRLVEWAHSAGFEPAGPYIELYHPAGPRNGHRGPVVEVRLTLKVPAPDAPSARRQPPARPAETQAAPAETAATAEMSTAELLALPDFAAVAARVVPAEAAHDAACRAFVEQVVFRVGALAKAAEQFDRGRADDLHALADALRARQTAVLPPVGAVPGPAQEVTPAEADGDPQAEARRSVLHDLDALLGRLMLGVTDGTGAWEELPTLLDRAAQTHGCPNLSGKPATMSE